MKDKRSFFEKLTGAVKIEDTEPEYLDHFATRQPARRTVTPVVAPNPPQSNMRDTSLSASTDWMEEEAEEGQLTIDVYQTGNDIVVKCMVAGVRPEDLEITITRDMVTIKGRRETEKTIREEDYYHQELYWGSFSRTVMLPAEVDVEEADAVEKHGLLIIKLPKIDKHRQAKLKVKGN
ncbi:MAG: Hsp20/alpha crystallin family protein [Candidatus Zambryskibacteria bacterium]|nr:Hsp20/alpha crystallin family protein [Candidatus Zambryskibacteria bacterium]